jgi:hypothetical protein
MRRKELPAQKIGGDCLWCPLPGTEQASESEKLREASPDVNYPEPLYKILTSQLHFKPATLQQTVLFSTQHGVASRKWRTLTVGTILAHSSGTDSVCTDFG